MTRAVSLRASRFWDRLVTEADWVMGLQTFPSLWREDLPEVSVSIHEWSCYYTVWNYRREVSGGAGDRSASCSVKRLPSWSWEQPREKEWACEAFLNVALRAGCSIDIWGRKVFNIASPVLKRAMYAGHTENTIKSPQKLFSQDIHHQILCEMANTEGALPGNCGASSDASESRLCRTDELSCYAMVYRSMVFFFFKSRLCGLHRNLAVIIYSWLYKYVQCSQYHLNCGTSVKSLWQRHFVKVEC